MAAPMTKSELINAVAQKQRTMTRREVEEGVNIVFEAMAYALREEERIEIRGFGSFTVRHRKARDGRNPRTGETVWLLHRRAVHFTVGKELLERVDAGRDK